MYKRQNDASGTPSPSRHTQQSRARFIEKVLTIHRGHDCSSKSQPGEDFANASTQWTTIAHYCHSLSCPSEAYGKAARQSAVYSTEDFCKSPQNSLLLAAYRSAWILTREPFCLLFCEDAAITTKPTTCLKTVEWTLRTRRIKRRRTSHVTHPASAGPRQ